MNAISGKIECHSDLQLYKHNDFSHNLFAGQVQATQFELLVDNVPQNMFTSVVNVPEPMNPVDKNLLLAPGYDYIKANNTLHAPRLMTRHISGIRDPKDDDPSYGYSQSSVYNIKFTDCAGIDFGNFPCYGTAGFPSSSGAGTQFQLSDGRY